MMRKYLYFLVVLFCLSCSKKNTVDDVTTLTGSVKLTVSAAGVADVTDMNVEIPPNTPGTKLASADAISLPTTEKIVESKEYVGTDFDAIVSLVEIPLPQDGSGKVKKIASTTAMANNIRYKVYVYTDSLSTFVGEINGESGVANSSATQAKPFTLQPNTKYTIIAFSWNNTTEPALSSGTPSSNPVFTNSSTNPELLYTKFTFTTDASDNFHIPITFKRQLAYFEVEINTLGLFVPMESIQASIPNTYVKYGSINLQSGTINSSFTSASGSNFSIDFPPISTSTYQVLSRSLGTLDTSRINNFTVTVSAMRLKLDNNDVRNYSDLKYSIATPITLDRGKLQRVRVQLIATARQVVAGTFPTRWAHADLYYAPNATEAIGGKYRIHSHNSNFYHATDSLVGVTNSYWNWNALTPGAGNEKTDTGDPCAQVYPAGTWRLPTIQEFQEYITPLSSLFYWGSADSRFIGRPAVFTGYQNEKQEDVKFIMYGIRNSTTSNNPNTISGFSKNGEAKGYYWSSTSVDADPSQAYLFYVQHAGSNEKQSDNGTTNHASIGRLNKNLGTPIRCVRARRLN